jgi:hypothetical protein
MQHAYSVWNESPPVCFTWNFVSTPYVSSPTQLAPTPEKSATVL